MIIAGRWLVAIAYLTFEAAKRNPKRAALIWAALILLSIVVSVAEAMAPPKGDCYFSYIAGTPAAVYYSTPSDIKLSEAACHDIGHDDPDVHFIRWDPLP